MCWPSSLRCIAQPCRPRSRASWVPTWARAWGDRRRPGPRIPSGNSWYPRTRRPTGRGSRRARDMHAGAAGVDRRARTSTILPMATGLWNAMPLTATVTQGSRSNRPRTLPRLRPSTSSWNRRERSRTRSGFRARNEAHRELAISASHGILLRGTPQACQIYGRRSRDMSMRATCRCGGFRWFGVWGFVLCAIAFHPGFSKASGCAVDRFGRC